MELLIIAGGLALVLLAPGITGTLTLRFTRGAENVPATSAASAIAITADNSQDCDFTLTDQETNKEVNTDIDASELQALFIYSDEDITLKANGDGAAETPADFTLTITGGKPFVWYIGCGLPMPLTDAEGGATDVATWYASTTSEDGATVKIRALYNNPSE